MLGNLTGGEEPSLSAGRPGFDLSPAPTGDLGLWGKDLSLGFSFSYKTGMEIPIYHCKNQVRPCIYTTLSKGSLHLRKRKKTAIVSYYQDSITEQKTRAALFSLLVLTISQNNLTIPSIFI